MAELLAASVATVIATGLGAVPVFAWSAPSQAAQGAMLGTAAGVMGVAAISGLLIPGIDEGGATGTLVGVLVGVAFMLLVRRRLATSTRITTGARRASVLIFVVLFAHSLPEGLAIGSAYASEAAGLGAFVVIAIAVQNVPEGTSIAIPMAAAGASATRQFWTAVASSVPQPLGAVLAYTMVQEVNALLPASFGFAAGAMAAVVVLQMVPDSLRLSRNPALTGVLAGAISMLVLSGVLGIPT